MKPFSILLVAALMLIHAPSRAQNTNQLNAPEPARPASSPNDTDRPKPTTAELEAKFKTTLTKATMTGRWCAIENGALGEEKEDKYTILGVSKLSGEAWIINARIQYGKKDIVAPIPILVKWAGDTPVLVVDKFPMPGGGVFSARVLIYEHTYAGSWTGGDHRGLLKGIIVNEAAEQPAPK